jgi:hypothetical protein
MFLHFEKTGRLSNHSWQGQFGGHNLTPVDNADSDSTMLRKIPLVKPPHQPVFNNDQRKNNYLFIFSMLTCGNKHGTHSAMFCWRQLKFIQTGRQQ